MTREEAIQHFKEQLDIFGGEHAEAIKVAIEALQNKSRPFGDCSKCIHTYGTLGCCTTVSNEWVYDCEHGMEQYKSTKAEPSDDLISRAEAIEAIELVGWYHQNNNKDMVHGANDDEHQAWYKADDVYKALEAVPSADRPRPIEPTITVDLESGVVPRSACEPKGPKTIIYADIPRGER